MLGNVSWQRLRTRFSLAGTGHESRSPRAGAWSAEVIGARNTLVATDHQETALFVMASGALLAQSSADTVTGVPVVWSVAVSRNAPDASMSKVTESWGSPLGPGFGTVSS